MENLAYLGGNKTVPECSQHYVWPVLSSATIKAVNDYLVNREPLSISTKTGIVKALEDAIASYVGVNYVLSTNSGSNALYAAYVSLNLEPGSEVIVQNVTFHASISPAIHCGLTPVIVDVDENGNMSVEALEKAITSKTRAVVVNHTWGHPADMDEIVEICKKNNLKLIEDCSHAFGATYNNIKVGNFGDVAVASMQASKTLSAGEGGLLMTNDNLLYQRASLVGHYRGRTEVEVTDENLSPYVHSGMGLKFRIHPIAAVIAYHEFQTFDEKIKNRAKLLDKLSDAFHTIKGIEAPHQKENVTMGSYYGFKPSFVPGELKLNGEYIDCDTYIQIMNCEGVEIHRPSVKPLNTLPIFAGERCPPFTFVEKTWKPRISGQLTGSEQYFENRLSLPTFTYPDSEEIVDLYISAFQKVSNLLG